MAKLGENLFAAGVSLCLALSSGGCIITITSRTGLDLSDITAYPECINEKFSMVDGFPIALYDSGMDIMLSDGKVIYIEKLKVPNYRMELYCRETSWQDSQKKEDYYYTRVKRGVEKSVSNLEKMLKEIEDPSRTVKFNISFCTKLNKYLCDSIEIDGKNYLYIAPQSE